MKGKEKIISTNDYVSLILVMHILKGLYGVIVFSSTESAWKVSSGIQLDE